MGKRIKKIIWGVTSFLKKEERVIDKNKILKILPHRGRMLLLDEVVITKKSIVGKFTITGDVCRGHEFNGQLVFRGVDIIEMAAQTLGVWLAQHPEFEKKLAFFRRLIGDIKFFGMVVPADLLIIEIPVEKEAEAEAENQQGNPRVEISGRPGRMIEKAIAANIIAKVGKDSKAFISGIELSIISPNIA